jgi:iron complex outermembrane receptor protein
MFFSLIKDGLAIKYSCSIFLHTYFKRRIFMKYIFTICLSLGIFQFLYSQVTISGKILDMATHQPLEHISISIPELKRGVVTDQQGNFSIADLKIASYMLHISEVGYASQNIHLAISKDTSFVVYLEESPSELNEVVIVGTSRTTELKLSPEPIVTVNQDYLKLSTSTNLIDALVRIPGLSSLTTGPNVSKPIIRGLGYNRVLSLFDGIRQDGQQWGDEHGIEIDQYLIDRVEIIKGPASLMYGSDAMGGAINLLPVSFAPEGTVKGDMQGNFQTNNFQIGGSAGMQARIHGINLGFRISHKQATNYQNKFDGRVFGTKYNETDFNFNIGINRKWGYSNLNFSLFDNTQEIPDGSRDSATRKFTKQISEEDTARIIVSDQELNSYTIGLIHQRVQHYRIYSQNYFFLGKGKLGVNLAYQLSHRREFSHPAFIDLAGLNLLLHTVTYDIKYYLPDLKGFKITVGMNGMIQVNKNTDATEFVIPDFTSFDFGPFAHVKKSLGKFEISAGIRFDARIFTNDALYTKPDPATGFDMQTAFNANDTTQTSRFDAYAHTFTGLSASFGATYNINKQFFIKANIAKGYRSPNIAEISAKGVHPGTGFEQLGDANLKPEYNWQFDLGLFYQGNHVSASIEGFYNTIGNYIFNQKLLSINGGDSLYTQPGTGTQFPVFKFIQTNAVIYGGEVSIDIHPHPLDWLHFENSISLTYAQNLGGNGAVINDSNKYLPFIPPLHTNHVIRAKFDKKMSCFKGLFFQFGLQYYAAQDRAFTAYGTETTTPAYFLIDASLGTDFVTKKGKRIFSIGVFGTNLADMAYQSNMSRLKYFDNYPVNYTGRSGIYSMGRNIVIKITVPFEIFIKKKKL